MAAPSYYRYDGSVRDPNGTAIPGADVAVLTQPAVFSTQPGSPLASIYAANASNSASLSSASWLGGQITFVFSTTPPSDVVAGSYIAVSGVTPTGYNSSTQFPWLVVSVSGNNVVVVAATNPGSYVSGGTVATSVLPNPTFTDGNGNYFFYASAGIYSIQIYGPTITEVNLLDQGVGTVAGGSVLSVAMTGDNVIFSTSISGSPITTSGTLNLATSLKTQTANKVLAGPTSGGAAAPTFRSLVAADMPGSGAGSGTVTSVAMTATVPTGFSASITGSPITTTGTLALTISLSNETANFVFAGPTTGAAAPPTFRALVVADIPITGYATFQSSLFAGPQQDLATVLSGATDAIVFPGTDFITTAGVDATTLATPTTGAFGTGNDGATLRIVDTSGHAHTVTTAANKIVPSHHLITFNGTAGSWIELIAYGGLWYPLANSGVVIS